MPSPSAALPAVLDCIDAELDNSIGRLFDFLRIQSISTDPAYAQQCKAAAEFVAKDLASLGFDAALRPTGGHPAVVAKANGAGNGKAPHVLFYGHYDVQPVDPLVAVGDAAVRAAHRHDARRPQDHRRARRLRRQRPGDDLRGGAARLQGGDRRACRCRSPC